MKFTKIATTEQIDQKWILIDAEGKTFGRMMTEVATLLREKEKLVGLQTLTVVTMLLSLMLLKLSSTDLVK